MSSSVVVWLFVALVAVSIILALFAGRGWGSVKTYERLRPERVVAQAVRDMQAVHDATVRNIVSRSVRSADQVRGHQW